MSDDAVKDALKMMPYGFYAITSRSEHDVNAMVANWVMQASFTPRLIAIALQKKAYSHEVIEDGGMFAVNIFEEEDQDALMPFTKGREKNPDKMKDAEYTESPETGCPVLAGAAAYVECQALELLDVDGDHDLLIGKVVGGDVMKPGDVDETLTLVDLGWSYAG